MADIKLKQGEAKTVTLTVTDGFGRKVDLTGATLFLGVKRNKKDASYLFFKDHEDFDTVAAGWGQAGVLLSSEDTSQPSGRLTGELKVTFPNLEVVKSDDFWITIEEAVTS